MKYVFWGHVSFSTDQRRDQAVTRLTNYVNQNPPTDGFFVDPQIGPYDGAYKGWPHALNFDFRYNTAADRDAAWDQAATFLGTGTAGPATRSFIEKFDSELDNPTADQGKQNVVDQNY